MKVDRQTVLADKVHNTPCYKITLKVDRQTELTDKVHSTQCYNVDTLCYIPVDYSITTGNKALLTVGEPIRL